MRFERSNANWAGHRLKYESPLVDGQRGFADRFGQGRMRVAGAGQIFRRAAEFHQHAGFGDQFAGADAEDVNAEHAVGRGVGENLHEAVGLAHRARAAIGGEGEFADLVGDALGLQLFLGRADRGDFRAWCRRRPG